jgi:chorismate synthase
LQTFRPGHADYSYHYKYGFRDPRGGGRSSARLTAPVVAAAAIAKKWLREHYGTEILAHMSQLGEIAIPFEDAQYISQNPFFAANASIITKLEEYMDQLRKAGDSCGAKIEVMARQVPIGLGEPLFDKLDADIAHVMMGINAVKGVEIGKGFGVVAQKGSAHGDEMHPDGFATNNAGGVLGGISTVSQPRFRPRGVTIPASAFERRQLQRPCWPLSSWTTPCVIGLSVAMFQYNHPQFRLCAPAKDS